MSSEVFLSNIIPFAGSGLVGYAIGFALKKILKWMLIIVGFLAGIFFVGVQLLQVRNVSLTRIGIGQRINKTQCISRVQHILLVGNTLDVELGLVAVVEEFGALDDNGVDIGQDTAGEKGCTRENIGELHDC